MYPTQSMRKFVCERLTEAARDILGAFESQVGKYEAEISRQRTLLEKVFMPELKLHRADLQTIHRNEELHVQNRPTTSDKSSPSGVVWVKDELEEICIRETTNVHRVTNEKLSNERETSTKTTEVPPNTQHNSENKVSSECTEPTAGPSCSKITTADRCTDFTSRVEKAVENPLINKQSEPALNQKTLDGNQTSARCVDSTPRGTEPRPVEGCNGDALQSTQRIELIPKRKRNDEILSNGSPATRPGDGKATERTNDIKKAKSSAPAEKQESSDETSTSSRKKRAISNESLTQNTKIRPSDGSTVSSTRSNNKAKLSESSDNRTSGSSAGKTLSAPSPSMTKKEPNGVKTERSGDTEPALNVGSEPAPGEKKNSSGYKLEDDENPYKCNRCGKVMSNFKNYKFHMRTHTVDKTFKCDICGKMFRESWALNSHVVVHADVKPFKCKVCGNEFNRLHNLKQHLRVHTGEKPYKCDTCGKAFSAAVNMHKHMRVHTGEKPYTCSDCGKSFADSSAFKIHRRVHTGEKPFKCARCKKTFATGTTLKKHARTHTGEKPYACSVCDKPFAYRADVNRHMRLHTGEKPYECARCGEKFSTWTYLDRHKLRHTSISEGKKF
ncbi:unnamed protein product [Ophioblennius macclurei]